MIIYHTYALLGISRCLNELIWCWLGEYLFPQYVVLFCMPSRMVLSIQLLGSEER